MAKRKALEEIDPNTRREQLLRQRQSSKCSKAKDFQERALRRPIDKPMKRTEIDWPRRRKLEVLTWLSTCVKRIGPEEQIRSHWRGVNRVNRTRLPTFKEAAMFWGGHKNILSEFTIRDWWNNRNSILIMNQKQYRLHSGPHEYWPEMEEKLFELFLKARISGKPVYRSWFQRQSNLIIQDLCAENPEIQCEAHFKFNHHWLHRFCIRWGVSRRRITKQAQRRSSDYQSLTNKFLQFCRRQLVGPSVARLLTQDPGPGSLASLMSCSSRIPPSNILNMDEVPLPYEFNEGYTYDISGNKTISVKTTKSGWDKRKATLILYIFADGKGYLQPKLIFHGTPDDQGGQIFQTEGHLYDPDVSVEFNKEAYNNGRLMHKWVVNELLPTLGGMDSLLVMDHASFHKTEDVLHSLRQAHVTPALIPAGCTSILQPLDVAINKPFKEKLRDELERHITEWEETERAVDTTSARRVLLTKIVGIAWRWLCNEKMDMVKKSFVSTGINISPDGSEDDKISIKDVKSSDIDFSGWEKGSNSQETCGLIEAISAEDEFDSNAHSDEIRAQYSAMTIQRLKPLLKERGLSTTAARKEILVDRIVNFEKSKLTE